MAMPEWPPKTCICFIAISILILMQPISAKSPQNIATDAAISGSRSDGLFSQPYFQPIVPDLANEESQQCEENYGFLPCSDGILGNLFLMVVYGFVMFKAAQLLSDGSEMLLVVLNPGIIGGLVLPVLGCLPDALLILVSGMAASAENAQSQVLVGMGLLAGSNVMLLTALWGTSLLVGRCDFQENGQAKNRTLTRYFDIFNTGITTDSQTSIAAWIMIITVIPYILAQVPHALNKPHLGRLFAIISCALAILGLISYCIYQVAFPWIQERRLYMAKEHLWRTSLLRHASRHGNLVKPDGTPNEETFRKIFPAFDEDKNGTLSEKELKAFIIGIGVISNYKKHLSIDEQAKNWMHYFDSDIRDGRITEEEFVKGMSKFVEIFVAKAKKQSSDGQITSFLDAESQRAEEGLRERLNGGGHEEEEDEDDDEDGSEKAPSKQMVILKAVMFILCGAIIAGLFSDPLVDTITNFSTASKIPTFFVAFIATPLATNSSEAISSIMFAAKKRKRNISMTYSQIYGGVTMNNTLCLGIFLAVVVVRGLVWDFSSEVTTIAVVSIVMGAIGGTRRNFPVWIGLVALVLYPVAILMIVFFDYVLHWT